jgi:hypothetical protein
MINAFLRPTRMHLLLTGRRCTMELIKSSRGSKVHHIGKGDWLTIRRNKAGVEARDVMAGTVSVGGQTKLMHLEPLLLVRHTLSSINPFQSQKVDLVGGRPEAFNNTEVLVSDVTYRRTMQDNRVECFIRTGDELFTFSHHESRL